VSATFDPTLAIWRQTSAGDNTVQVRVQKQVLTPGVQNRREADLSSQSPHVGGQRQQGGRSGVEEQIVKERGILQHHGVQCMRQREDDMEVRHRQEAVEPSFNPGRLLGCLTLGAMAVAAGVVRDASEQ